MENFEVFSSYGWQPKPKDLEGFIVEALQDDRLDQIDQLRAEVSKLQGTLARLLVTLYANGNSPIKFRLGLDMGQLDDVLDGAGIKDIRPVK